jgi:Kef-type K+ transport system membrane component KefB
MLSLNDWGRVLVSVIVVAGFIMILVLVLTTKLQGNASSEVMLVMLGALAAGFGQVVSYWVGSSASSSAKDQTISTMATKP